MCFEIISFEARGCTELNKIYHFLKVHTPNIVSENLQIKAIEYLSSKLLRIVSTFSMPSRLLRAPIVLYQMKFVWNFAVVKCYSIFKRVCPRITKKLPLWFSQKIKISSQFFVEYFYKNIHNFRIKMFY